MKTMTLHQTKINSIPVLELYPALPAGKAEDGSQLSRPPQSLPLVFIFHGFDSCKERKLQHAYIMAQRGFFVVMPDAVRHGEREDSTFAALTYSEKAEFLFDIVTETAGELDSLIQHYSQSSVVDSSRSAVVGTSMGGMILYQYLARPGHEGITAGVSIISTPNFGSIIDNSLEQNPDFYNAYSQTKIDRVKASQPLPQVRKLEDFPLLMLNAEDDTIMPIMEVRNFFTELKHQYTQPEKLRLKTFKDTGHQTTEAMMHESADWLKSWI
ncbi:MAG: prolyl oligopeptidase family serine peptidase [Spirochaetota bacterium]